ncbi:MAG: ComEC/Rec2 family competence protein, partial [Bacteroidales bacterium]|nr:ComEC/Rec2 family competence protein [Bacteroidales bacterium]
YADKLWALTTVSLAAQLGTTPISLYYFNQFPNMFFLTNLLVIPLAAVILYLAFLLFVFSFVPFVNEALGWLLSISAQLMIKAVEIVEAIPFSYSGGIYFSLIQTFCFYGLIILITTYALLKKRWMIFASLFIAIFFFVDIGLRRVNLENNHSFTVYAIRGTSLINFTDGRTAIFFADSLNFPLEKYDFQISKHRLVSGINDYKIHSYNDSLERINDNLKKIENFFVWNNTLIYRLGNGAMLPKNLPEPIKTDYILVSGNVYLPPEKIDSIFLFKKIILDSSVKTYLAEKWLKNPLYANRVHYVERDGAFVFVN